LGVIPSQYSHIIVKQLSAAMAFRFRCKFTPEEVHDSNKKFAGWKCQPSNKMRLEADHGGAIHCGILHRRDVGFQLSVFFALI
jgi:hypothetical protein